MSNFEKEADPKKLWDTTSVRSATDSSSEGDDEAMEVKEVQNASKADTTRINRWRIVLGFVLLATALSVSACTFIFLDKEQRNSFDVAVRK